MSQKSHLEDRFWQMLSDWGIQERFRRQVQFHPERRWKTDFICEADKIAVEIEGGVFIGGRHQYGATFVKDTEKYNMLTAMGYRLFRFARVMDMKEFFNLYAMLKQEDLERAKRI